MRMAMAIALLAATLAAPTHAEGQTAPLVPTEGGVATIITFNLQLNMTNLSPDLERVRLACFIQSPAYSWQIPTNSGTPGAWAAMLPGAEIYADQGKAVGTLSVQFPIATAYLAPDAVGKQATYGCMLIGYSSSLQRWDTLGSQQTTPAFRVSTTAAPMTGTFVW